VKTHAEMNASRTDIDLIYRIVDRALELMPDARRQKLQLVLSVTACHLNGCPLELEDLAKAPAGDLAHDVFGIHRHVDRASGELLDCFLPRYARRGGA
jgi:hypothetical protein